MLANLGSHISESLQWIFLKFNRLAKFGTINRFMEKNFCFNEKHKKSQFCLTSSSRSIAWPRFLIIWMPRRLWGRGCHICVPGTNMAAVYHKKHLALNYATIATTLRSWSILLSHEHESIFWLRVEASMSRARVLGRGSKITIFSLFFL